MLRNIKLATLRLLKRSRVFELVGDSDWRRRRLLILCYHGTSLERRASVATGTVHASELLQQRFEILKRGRYAVLPLGEGSSDWRGGTLPARSVAITFDDGTHDFYKAAYPVLKAFGFPVTVYQTTYHTDYQRPFSISLPRTCCGSGAAR